MEEEPLENLIDIIEEKGVIIDEYPVDESQEIINAGDAVVYEYNGRKYEIITWNEEAVKHRQGDKEINEIIT